MTSRGIVTNTWVMVLSVLTSVMQVQAYSRGAPGSVCGGMTPSHGGAGAQNSAPPYTLTTTASSYSAGQSIQVTLSGSVAFEGFLLKAVTSSGSIVGSFTTSSSTQSVSCTGGAALTHNSNSAKNSVTTSWSSSSAVGDITFQATVVKTFDTFWLGVTSSTVSGPSGGSPGGGSAATTTPAATSIGNLDLTSCGTTKGCFQFPCPNGNGNCAVVTWSPSSSSLVTFELSGQTDGWVAVGFSSDQDMGDDSVAHCVNDGSGHVIVQSSYNIPALDNQLLSNPSLGVSLVSSQFTNGAVTCTFTRQVSNAADSKFFDISQPYYLMVGYGTASGGDLSYHTVTPAVSDSKVSVTSSLINIGSSDSAPSSLEKAHGALMVIAWVLFASVGIILSHTMRTTLRGKKLLDSPLWLGLHRIFLIAAIVCTAVAFIIIFVETNGIYIFQLTDPVAYQLHGALGIISMILALVNPIIILARPKPGTSGYKPLTLVHKIIGFVLHPMAGITMLLGVSVFYPSNVEDYALFWLLIVAVIVHIAADLLLVFDERCTRGNSVSSNGDLEMSDTSNKAAEANEVKDTTSVEKASSKQAKNITRRLSIFIVYAVIMGGLTIAMIVLIGQS